MKAMIPLAVVVVVPLALVYAMVRISRWHAGHVDDVDGLIATNAATYVKGMEKVDWRTKAERGADLGRKTPKPHILPMTRRRP